MLAGGAAGAVAAAVSTPLDVCKTLYVPVPRLFRPSAETDLPSSSHPTGAVFKREGRQRTLGSGTRAACLRQARLCGPSRG